MAELSHVQQKLINHSIRQIWQFPIYTLGVIFRKEFT